MKKLIGDNRLYLIGKPLEIKLQLSKICNEDMLLSDLIKKLSTQYKNSLN